MLRRLLTIGLALFVLNASLTFRNLWPTPGIAWHGDLSIELALSLIALAVFRTRRSPPATMSLRSLSVLWTTLVIGRYAEVTAPALYGRDINLYWDLRFIPDVVRMVVRAAPIWIIVASLAGAVSALVLFYRIVSMAWRVLAAACADPRTRRGLIGLSTLSLFVWAGRVAVGRSPFEPPFARPVAIA